MTVKLRQSMAKVLLSECPAVLRQQMQRGRHSTRAMAAGSLVDYLVFGQNDKFAVVDAVYASGKREGQQCTDWLGGAAKEAKAVIEAEGKLAVLQSEIDTLQPAADAILARIHRLAREKAGDWHYELVFQQAVSWNSALGVECHTDGIDALLIVGGAVGLVYTIDLKHTAALQQAKFERQIHAMGWDIQGAAYAEASVAWALENGWESARHVEHIIVASSAVDIGIEPPARPLSETYMAVGKKDWATAQSIWMQCVETDKWPSYPETPAEPPRHVVTQAFGYAESDLSDLDLTFGDKEKSQ